MNPQGKRILIIGAGIAGTVAARALSRYRPVVVDARESIAIHDAVMHLRDPGVAKYLGVSVREACVRKEIWYGGRLHSRPSIFFNNLYSLKLYGHLGRRSLNGLGDVKRWLIDGPIPTPDTCLLGAKVSTIQKGTEGVLVELDRGDEGLEAAEFDWIVSTAPMSINFQLAGISPVTTIEEAKKVFTCRILLSCQSSIHQVIYFPDPTDGSVYRASIDGPCLSIESNKPVTGRDISLVAKAFGLERFGVLDGTSINHGKIEFGKIPGMPEIERRANILRLTQGANLFSFGRHAIWKPIRTDHLPDDIDKIQRMIESTDVLLSYEQNHYRGAN